MIYYIVSMPFVTALERWALCFVQNAFQYFDIVPKHRRVIIERNRLGSIGTWQCCVFD